MFLRQLGAATLLLLVAACGTMPGGDGVARGPVTSAPPVASIPSLLAAADAARQDGRFEEAMPIYQQILLSDPKSLAAKYGMAECLLGSDKAGDARAIYEELAQNAEFHARALQGEGLVGLTLSQREQAAKALRAATEADPSLWRSWNGLGLLADLKRQPQEAQEAYSHALAANPDSAVLHNNLGYSRLLAGKPDEAMVELRKAYGIDPDSETIQNNVRLVLAAKGNYAAAVKDVPRHELPAVLNNVGYVAMQRGDLSAAETYLARAMEDSPNYNTIASQNIEQLKAKKGEGQ
ncbi:hypothetical protein GCM10011611_20160 [Aliidongia dinghuensis]|uniref:Tetratricopeptide repeat protein n=1 Tax=Aliidongia dinghuensis TaxID=1867774 RepID=A0A8J2YTJ0_9PROT|nr:tetratricopeptide repeat protein [Aliidongia dinghuensis]GGF14341.1 hypothetical protein GCM10011611_20160 [Aliidongia dinghuensis]